MHNSVHIFNIFLFSVLRNIVDTTCSKGLQNLHFKRHQLQTRIKATEDWCRQDSLQLPPIDDEDLDFGLDYS